MELTCKGIVLNSYDLKEKDKIIVIFTDIAGKISLVAKNVKTFRSENREAIMLFSKSSFILREGRNLYSLKSAYLEKAFKMNSYENYELACKFSNIMNKLVPEDYSNIKLFTMFSNFLTYIENNISENKDFVLTSFVLKFLYLLGHYPAFSKCLCGNRKCAEYFLNIQESQLYCADCIEESYQGQSVRISEKTIRGMDYVLKWDYIPEKTYDDKQVNGVMQIVEEYMKWHFHFRI